jgi:hypothetical protein
MAAEEFEIQGGPAAEAAFADILERARKNTGPRQHHLIPASYLDRWSVAGRVQWTDLDSGRSQEQRPAKMARERDYYRLPADAFTVDDLPPMLLETLLSDVEASGKAAIDALLRTDRLATTSKERIDLATFMGMQYVRGERGRSVVRESTSEYHRVVWSDVTDEGIADLLRQEKIEPTSEVLASARDSLAHLDDRSLRFEPEETTQMVFAVASAQKVAEYLLRRSWVLYRGDGLITCDEPVVPIGGPGTDRKNVSGIGNAAVVAFPLSPDALLVMHQPGQHRYPIGSLTSSEIVEINREVAGNAARLAFDRPGRHAVSALKIPRRPDTAVRSEEFPGRTAEESLVRMFRLSRWSSMQKPPPWPVRRWYRE